MFSTTVLSLFPEIFPGALGFSLVGKALEKGVWKLNSLQIREFATDKHKAVDDTPYGGGAGMVMRPDVLDLALTNAMQSQPNSQIVYFTPRGIPFNQKLAHELVKKDLIMICGRFEGVDERFLQAHDILEISLGDFVLSGGEIAAMAVLDACVRLLPDVIGSKESLNEESFAINGDFAGLIEYPHYTKPPIWNGQTVPEVLLSGNHASIKDWRLGQARDLTRKLRPDLWAQKHKSNGEENE